MRVLFLLFNASIYSPFPTKTCQISCKTKIFCTFLLIYLHISIFFRTFAAGFLVRTHVHIRTRNAPHQSRTKAAPKTAPQPTKRKTMGVYINTGKAEFESVRVDEYIDKSMLIAYVNSVLGSQQRKFMCVTRARRFGKSIAAKMLCAYYDQSCNSHALFDDLKIAKDPSYEKHINHYPVIYLDVSGFTGDANIDKQRIVQEMTDALRKDLAACYPDAPLDPSDSLPVQLLKVAEFTQKPFIMIVDEWDAVLRELEDDTIKRAYVDWLRTMFKNGYTNRIFAAVYMTGILPIKQYNTESALNNFVEFSMVTPGKLAGYFGFTKQEVHALCKKHKMDEAQIKQWYDGYQMGDKMEIYNPFAVMCAMVQGRIMSYWTSTAAYESLKRYITMNFAGLKDAVIELLAGQEVRVDVKDFAKDIHEVNSRDGVLTLLIHLGYLSYDENRGVVRIPNFEVQQEFERTIRDEKEWGRVTKMLIDSEKNILLQKSKKNTSPLLLEI